MSCGCKQLISCDWCCAGPAPTACACCCCRQVVANLLLLFMMECCQACCRGVAVIQLLCCGGILATALQCAHAALVTEQNLMVLSLILKAELGHKFGQYCACGHAAVALLLLYCCCWTGRGLQAELFSTSVPQ